jgi:transposase
VHGRVTKAGRVHARGMLVEAAWVATTRIVARLLDLATAEYQDRDHPAQ